MVEQPKTNTKEHKAAPKAVGKVAIVLIRSFIDASYDRVDTLKMLNLTHKNRCAVLDATPSVLGMVRKVKDLVTWGELNAEVVQKLGPGKIFALHPPRKGFGRKGVKIPFNIGGGLGYRGDKINDLLLRMMK